MKDEFNLKTFIHLLKSNLKLMAGLTVFFVLIAVCVNTFSTPQYMVKATFFISPQSNADRGSLSRFSGFLGGQLSTDMSKYVYMLMNSETIQDKVQNALSKEFSIESKVGKYFKLSKRINIAQDNFELFSLKYYHDDPKVAFRVVEEYMSNLYQFNSTYNLSAQKEVFTLLDKPSIPDTPFKPRKLINLVMGVFVGLFLSIIIIMFRYEYQST